MRKLNALTERILDRLVGKTTASAGCSTRSCPGRPGCYQTCCNGFPCNNNCFC